MHKHTKWLCTLMVLFISCTAKTGSYISVRCPLTGIDLIESPECWHEDVNRAFLQHKATFEVPHLQRIIQFIENGQMYNFLDTPYKRSIALNYLQLVLARFQAYLRLEDAPEEVENQLVEAQETLTTTVTTPTNFRAKCLSAYFQYAGNYTSLCHSVIMTYTEQSLLHTHKPLDEALIDAVKNQGLQFPLNPQALTALAESLFSQLNIFTLTLPSKLASDLDNLDAQFITNQVGPHQTPLGTAIQDFLATILKLALSVLSQKHRPLSTQDLINYQGQIIHLVMIELCSMFISPEIKAKVCRNPYAEQAASLYQQLNINKDCFVADLKEVIEIASSLSFPRSE